MELRFDATQEHQLAAIEAACGLFEGQPHVRSELSIFDKDAFPAIANRLDLSEGMLLGNLQSVQGRTGIEPDNQLEIISESLPDLGDDVADFDSLENAGGTPVQFPNFSIEMETGTGKTYVYLRTVMELYRRFGLRKFIIVVPSVAVREGVYKTLRITEAHLKALYDNPPYRYS